MAHHNIGKRYETIFAISGVSSPNCGGKIEVRFLFMAYSLGMRVHPPLYIGRFEDGMSSFINPNNVVELVYNGSRHTMARR